MRYLVLLCLFASPADAMVLSGFVSHLSGDTYHLSLDYAIPYDGRFPQYPYPWPIGEPIGGIVGLVSGGSHLEADFTATGEFRGRLEGMQDFLYDDDNVHTYFPIYESANLLAVLPESGSAPITQTPEPTPLFLLLTALGLRLRRS
jgi:hypothetical protein